MAKFLVVFYGGKMAATPAEQKKSMDEWTKWFAGLGKAVADQGSPTIPPGKSVDASGISAGVPGGVGGYSILFAADVDAAAKMAAGAPGIKQGMTAAVYPLFDMTAAAPKK